MKWLIDFDDTVNEFQYWQCKTVNEKFGANYSSDQITDWDWWGESVDQDHERYAWGKDVFHNREWTLSIPPKFHAVAALQVLQRWGDELYLVSDRDPHMREWLIEWLRKYHIRGVHVITTSYLTYPKAKVAQELGLRFAVEDAPHNITDLAASRTTPELIYVMDKPWNRDLPDLGHHVVRVTDWSQIIQHQTDHRGSPFFRMAA